MKKLFVLLVMPLLVAAAVAFMTACDENSGEGGSSECVAGTWSVVTPQNGATNVDCSTNFVLK